MGEDKTWTPGPWTPTSDPVHGPLSWTGSIDAFYFDRKNQGGLATAFDLAAFRLSMIAPVKKPVNHSRTVASMRETG